MGILKYSLNLEYKYLENFNRGIQIFRKICIPQYKYFEIFVLWGNTNISGQYKYFEIFVLGDNTYISKYLYWAIQIFRNICMGNTKLGEYKYFATPEAKTSNFFLIFGEIPN